MSEGSDTNSDNGATRASQSKKIPAYLPSPSGEAIHLTKKMRSIIRRIPTANSFGKIADEMRCSKGMVSHVFHLPAVQEYLKSQMEAAGITHGLLMQRIREGLDAVKEGRGLDENQKPEKITDYTERRANVELALKLQGLSQVAPEPGGQTINNNILFNIVMAAREKRGLKD